MRVLKHGYALALALVLAACVSTISIKSPREGVAVCYKSVETVLVSAGDIKARGKLSPATQAAVVDSADQALIACDVARDALVLGNPVGAGNALQVATAILLQIEAILSEAQ